jgi:hypothetical protein
MGLRRHAGNDEPVEMKGGEDLGHDPARLQCRLRPQEHHRATVSDRGLEFVTQQAAKGKIGVVDPRLKSVLASVCAMELAKSASCEAWLRKASNL